MKIMFCGAASGVTGSCHLLTSGDHQILLDCGQFQGGKAQEAMNYDPFPFDPTSIEAVILSHAHIDHCGRLPLLVKRGFKGKIYCTTSTADLLTIMLKDSAYIHEKDAEWQNRKAMRSGRNQIEPLYTEQDAEDALKLVEPVLYDQLIEMNDLMQFVFNDAGHILGSAITELWVTENGKTEKIVFSGDLGMTNRPILRDPTYIKKADCVIMESTYGNRLHPANAMSVKQLIDIVLKTINRGGNVVIPSFAVGRTQELIYQFNRYYLDHKDIDSEMDKIHIYVDSPMATSATEIFKRNAQDFDEETKAYILQGDNPLDFKNLTFTLTSEESRQLNFDKTPKVIISASGMCEAGRIRHHLKHNLWDPKNSIVFVGYQAQGTLGRALIEGTKEVTLFGEDIQVKAEIYNLEGFSGHADQNGLFSWISSFEKPPKQLFLVHGEEQSKKDFAKLIKSKLGYDPIVILGNSEFEIDLSHAELINYKEAQTKAAEEFEVQDVRNRISDVHDSLEKILYNANLAVDSGIDQKKIIEINNIIQELQKTTMNLGTVVNDKSGDLEQSEDPADAGEQRAE